MKTCDDFPGDCCEDCHTDQATVDAGDLDSGGLLIIYGHEHPPQVYARVCCAKAHAAHQSLGHRPTS